MGLIDNIRARRAMRNNRINIPINTERFDNAIGKSTPTFVREEPKPMNIQVNSNAIDKSMSNIQLPTFQSSRPNPEIPEWQKYGFKSQDEMNFWENRAKSWSGGKLNTIQDVINFQKSVKGLDADGRVGWRTIEAFNNIYNPKAPEGTIITKNRCYSPDMLGVIQAAQFGLLKKGGTIKKFANGGQMGEFISFIKKCVGINDDSQLKSFMQKIGKKGLAMFKQAYDKGMTPQQVRKALQGQNNASSAQQSSYMKKGGCIACEMQNGGRFKYTKQELQKANAKANVNQIPVLVNSLKCGGKTRKKLIKKR